MGQGEGERKTDSATCPLPRIFPMPAGDLGLSRYCKSGHKAAHVSILLHHSQSLRSKTISSIPPLPDLCRAHMCHTQVVGRHSDTLAGVQTHLSTNAHLHCRCCTFALLWLMLGLRTRREESSRVPNQGSGRAPWSLGDPGRAPEMPLQ